MKGIIMSKPICIYGIKNKDDYLLAIKHVKAKNWSGGKNIINYLYSDIYALCDDEKGLHWDSERL